jgi:hypothetical protein
MKFLVAAHLLVGTISAQIIGNAPRNFVLDGSIQEWDQHAPSFVRPGDPRYQYWISRVEQGLVIAGTGSFYDLPRDRTELSTKGRLEVWFSVTPDVEMPPISWSGDDATEETCKDREGPAERDCQKWFEDQSIYRERIKAQFFRMWRIAPSATEEVYASTNYASLIKDRNRLPRLKPSGQLTARFLPHEGSRFTYEILVPWEAFPLADRLVMERVHLEVELVDGHSRRGGRDPLARPMLRSFAVVPPIQAHFTPCGHPLVGASGERAFGSLGPKLEVRNAFVFHNFLLCCGAIQGPLPGQLSPALVDVEPLLQALGPGEFVCGSPISYRKGAILRHSQVELGFGTDFHFLTDKPRPGLLPVRRLPDGTRLLRYGPFLWLQEQTYTRCVSCPFVQFKIVAISPNGAISQALDLGTRIDTTEYDIEISANWRTVTEFENSGEKWVAKKFCLTGRHYEPCGVNEDSPPPKNGLVPNQN